MEDCIIFEDNSTLKLKITPVNSKLNLGTSLSLCSTNFDKNTLHSSVDFRNDCKELKSFSTLKSLKSEDIAEEKLRPKKILDTKISLASPNFLSSHFNDKNTIISQKFKPKINIKLVKKSQTRNKKSVENNKINKKHRPNSTKNNINNSEISTNFMTFKEFETILNEKNVKKSYLNITRKQNFAAESHNKFVHDIKKSTFDGYNKEINGKNREKMKKNKRICGLKVELKNQEERLKYSTLLTSKSSRFFQRSYNSIENKRFLNDLCNDQILKEFKEIKELELKIIKTQRESLERKMQLKSELGNIEIMKEEILKAKKEIYKTENDIKNIKGSLFLMGKGIVGMKKKILEQEKNNRAEYALVKVLK